MCFGMGVIVSGVDFRVNSIQSRFQSGSEHLLMVIQAIVLASYQFTVTCESKLFRRLTSIHMVVL